MTKRDEQFHWWTLEEFKQHYPPTSFGGHNPDLMRQMEQVRYELRRPDLVLDDPDRWSWEYTRHWKREDVVALAEDMYGVGEEKTLEHIAWWDGGMKGNYYDRN